MSSRVLPFTAPAEPPTATDRYGKPLSEHQRVISEAMGIFSAVDGEVPTPALVGRWLKRICAGDGNALLDALNQMADKGALNKSLAYSAVVLRNGVERGDFVRAPAPAAPAMCSNRDLLIGQLSRDGQARWSGLEWEPVAAASHTSEDFEVLWSACAKRINKGGAARAFAELGRDGKLPPISELVEKLTLLQATEQWTIEDRKYQPLLVNWLNREGWLDEIPPGWSAFNRRAVGADPEDLAAYAAVGKHIVLPDEGDA